MGPDFETSDGESFHADGHGSFRLLGSDESSSGEVETATEGSTEENQRAWGLVSESSSTEEVTGERLEFEFLQQRRPGLQAHGDGLPVENGQKSETRFSVACWSAELSI